MTTISSTNYPYRLVATDLDGTLLRSDGSISARTAQTLGRLAGKGATLVLVSARPPRTIGHIARRYGFTGLAICCNGAIVYDLAQETIVQHTPLSHEIGLRFASALKKDLPGASFAWERELEFGCEPRFAELQSRAADQIVNPVDFHKLDESPFTKLIVLDPDHTADVLLARARSYGESQLTITHSGAPFIEISARGVDKASALLNLVNERGIPVSRIIAFGDMPNDLPMLDLAGYAVAVANAHPSVLARVDELTLSNDDDGVAVVLERLF